MMIALALLYLVAPAFVAFGAFVDLWAKAYDLAWGQSAAKAVLAVGLGVLIGASARLAAVAVDSPGTAWGAWLVGVLATPPFAVMLWWLRELDWRGCFAAAVLGPWAAYWLLPHGHTWTPVAIAVVVGATTAGLAVARERRTSRLQRYAKLLKRGCSCCGYKQRAVHELSALGPEGRQVVMEFLTLPSSRYETRVKEEWHICHATTG